MSIQRVFSYHPSSQSHWKYDVFLSFRGEDTRKNFTDHLYAALDKKGVILFRDDKELERGESISPGLFKAIEESRISIIVFSRNYAYSTWCLDELVKIVECKNAGDHKQMVFPIFYDVEPTVVRKQTESFRDAFSKHEEAFRENIEKVQKWRDALREVANISGWELKDRNESEFIVDIVKELSSKIPIKSGILKELVGIDSRLGKLRFLIDKGPNDVRMIGICGMGGIGKTTLARVFYDLVSHKFEATSFLANVGEISEKGGLISLQKQLLSQLLKVADVAIWNVYDGINMIGSRLRHRKVLLVIDDVVEVKQLTSLAGNHDWFGSGSRIVITSRDKHLLMTHGVDEVYMSEQLNYDEALGLFCFKAFKTHHPWKGYEQLSDSVVKYAGGLPLALKVLGSFLFGRSIAEWESALQRLKRDPESEILGKLQISFDGLKATEKQIFLDIACFYKGKYRDYVTKILDYCDFDPIIGIGVLIEKSLLTVDNYSRLWMHDLLQEMGQQIVKKQSPEEPGKRSRLWEEADIRHVLSQDTGSGLVEGIVIDYYFPKNEVYLRTSAKAFSKMTNLRLLKICNLPLPEGLEYLPNKLRFLEWHGYPLKSLPSNLQLEKIFELNMCYSRIEELWKGIKPLNMLKVMKLSHSQNLIKTPDFTGVPNLEELILEGCTRLCEIHPSLLHHNKLIILNLKVCTSLMTLPGMIFMKSLKTLVLSGCSKLKMFPEVLGSMGCLLELLLDGTAIEELPLSIRHLTGLISLNLENCANLVRLPSTINGLTSLKNLNLSGCSKPKNVPESFEKVESLEELDVSGTAFRKQVTSIFSMKNLEAQSFLGCKETQSSTSRYLQSLVYLRLPYLSGLCSLRKLDLSDCNIVEGAIPGDIGNLCSLEVLNLSKNSFLSLPASINRLLKLEELELEYCRKLQSLPQLPPNIMEIRVDGCASLGTLLNAFKLCTSEYTLISCMNDLKLHGNSGLPFSMLKLHLESLSNRKQYLSIVVPGSEIPEWFMYRNEGSSIRFQFQYYRVAGYAICCVFHVPRHSASIKRWHPYPTRKLNCYNEGSSTNYFIDFRENFGQALSDHLWLLYLSNEKCNFKGKQFSGDFMDDNWLECDSVYDSFEVELSFRSELGPGLEVKRCGVHPIYFKEWSTKSGVCVVEEPQPKRLKPK